MDFDNYLYKVGKWKMCAKNWEVLQQEPLRKRGEWSRKTDEQYMGLCVLYRWV
jgi:hypothetical protein